VTVLRRSNIFAGRDAASFENHRAPASGLGASETGSGFGNLRILRSCWRLRTVLKLSRQPRALAANPARADGPGRQTARHPRSSHANSRFTPMGKRIRVDIDGRAMEAESGQLLLNFDQVELKRLLEFRTRKISTRTGPRAAASTGFSAGWSWSRPERLSKSHGGLPEGCGTGPDFGRSAGEPGNHPVQTRATSRTRSVITWRLWSRSAIRAGPSTWRISTTSAATAWRALEHYQSALTDFPSYADAHYNLALLYQGANQPMKGGPALDRIPEARSIQPLVKHRAAGVVEAPQGGGGPWQLKESVGRDCALSRARWSYSARGPGSPRPSPEARAVSREWSEESGAHRRPGRSVRPMLSRNKVSPATACSRRNPDRDAALGMPGVMIWN